VFWLRRLIPDHVSKPRHKLLRLLVFRADVWEPSVRVGTLAGVDLVTFSECAGGSRWKQLLDTNIADLEGGKVFTTGEAYDVTARSLLLFALQLDGA
jgi:hypothetical protein